MPSNHQTLQDEDSDYPDWFELKNNGASPVNLSGFSVTDDKNEIFKWNFPSYQLSPGRFIVIYASGKDKKTSPVFNHTIINEGDTWKYKVPQEDIPDWTRIDFDDSEWDTGPSGFGYADNDDATILPQAYSVFMRKKFMLEDTSLIREIFLHIDYDDAFVAYLNDVEIARSNIGQPGIRPSYNETAESYHEALMYQGSKPEKYPVPEFKNIIRPGENLLAVQVHNFSIASSDFSAIPFLTIALPYQPQTAPPGFIPEVSGGFHSNFRLDADGDSLYLVDYQGNIIHEVVIKQTPPDISLGFIPGDYSTLYGFADPSPWMENAGQALEYATSSPLVFDPPGGYHPSSIEVTITSGDPMDTIYFTLDGSEPGRESILYNNAIRVTEPLTIRAKIFHEGRIPSEVQTVSYYPGVEKDLPILFLSTDPDNLWDYYTGIYVMGPNAQSEPPHFGANFWQDWEKPAHLEYFDPKNNQYFSIGAGIRIYGNYSRQHPMKSIAIYARSEYGNKSIRAKLFENSPLDEFEAIVLRNSGNEWFGNNSQSGVLFRDLLMTSVARDINIDAPAGRPVVVYINGNYWGIHNLREKINEHFVADNHEYAPDDINLLEFNGNIIEGSNTNYLDLLNLIRYNDITDPENYQEVSSRMDIDEFIRYCLLEIFYYNGDWPGNNIKYWQSASDNSKWRWIMFDTDFGFGLWDVNKVYHNTLEFATTTLGDDWPNPPWSTFLLRSLLKNPEFKNRFINTFADHLNSTLLADSLISRINKHKNDIASEMYDHIDKWGGYYSNWTLNIQQMRNFARIRPGVMRSHIKEFFSLPNSYDVAINVEGCDDATVRVNTIKLKQFPWTGSYFGNVPVEVTAIPPEGYQFVRWKGTINSDTAWIESKMLSNENITAVFAPVDPETKTGVVINEIFYKSTEDFDPGDWLELYNNNDEFVDVSGWQLRDIDDNNNFDFEDPFILEPGSYTIICRNMSKFNLHYPDVQNFTGNLNFGFSGEGDCIRLFNNENELVDSLCYGTEYPWPSDPDGLGYSLSLKNPEMDNTLASNWFTSRYKGGTPGKINETNLQSVGDNPGDFQSAIKVFPNPFSSELTISVFIENPGKAELSIHDINGRLINSLGNEINYPGNYLFKWKPEKVSAGIYYIRYFHSGSVSIKKVVFHE